MNSKTKCKVNSDGSVCLRDILSSFNSSVKEEHAWALCYQCAKYFNECLQTRKQNCYIITEVQHVYLKTDGNIHENTVLAGDTPRKLLRCEKDIVGGIGVVIYTSLDPEIQSGEERVISNDLEQLISDMITDDLTSSSDHSHHETDDEGIERDSEESDEPSTSKSNTQITLLEVIKRCENHLGTLTKTQAEAHYKAVVRALVAEALELSMFLEKVAQGSISLPTNSSNSNLNQLQFSDWAKFWVQVMGELRTGVKLKKVNFSKAPIEYELTPYEILMKDIRNCKYNLRKIMVNGDVPSKVTKDAHAIILEFIRSRPPLRKVSDRKLAPQSRTLTPREQLLNSIKKGRKLRPVPVPRTSRRVETPKSSPKDVTTPLKPPSRRLIKVDFSQFEDEDDDDEPDSTPDSTEPGLWSNEYPEICDSTLEAYDLATQDYSRSSVRRNTLDVVDTNLGSYSVPQSRPGSRQSCNSSEAESVQLEADVARQIQEELTCSQNWQDTISLDDRLSLTLSEIVHIRTVLTKAELEALPVEGRVRHDVEARKICLDRFPKDASPDYSQAGSSMNSSIISDPGSLGRFRTKAVTVGRASRAMDRFKGSQMMVCHDCKMMVLQIIKSARANRSAIRNKTIQSLTLNLSPVF
ncbi:hypothetical protein NQ314_002243 [Rhamnusium bicolor]|uniref:Uncharacterized protein n=1 Tax=Rhamnusium bicolor TaxID=1586634 RepID=A0AAV8ZTI4_9CUCU|nr:hypothetical protein NQ314_002243 [Rhamnusium bicolor]